jgi:hypothetical protein
VCVVTGPNSRGGGVGDGRLSDMSLKYSEHVSAMAATSNGINDIHNGDTPRIAVMAESGTSPGIPEGVTWGAMSGLLFPRGSEAEISMQKATPSVMSSSVLAAIPAAVSSVTAHGLGVSSIVPVSPPSPKPEVVPTSVSKPPPALPPAPATPALLPSVFVPESNLGADIAFGEAVTPTPALAPETATPPALNMSAGACAGAGEEPAVTVRPVDPTWGIAESVLPEGKSSSPVLLGKAGSTPNTAANITPPVAGGSDSTLSDVHLVAASVPVPAMLGSTLDKFQRSFGK